MSGHSTKLDSREQSATTKRLGIAFACASLLCSLLVWLEWALSYLSGVPGQNLTGFQWLQIMAVAVVLALVAVALRSKLWKLVLPLALAIFFS